jgi:hypothetical protein
MVLLAVKFGLMWDLSGEWFGYDACPTPVKNSLACSLNHLGVDCIDIYRPSRLDPTSRRKKLLGQP